MWEPSEASSEGLRRVGVILTASRPEGARAAAGTGTRVAAAAGRRGHLQELWPSIEGRANPRDPAGTELEK